MDRRRFLSWFGVGTLAGSLPWAIAACTPQSGTGTGSTPAASGEFKAVGTLAQLDQSGQLLAKDGLAKPALIVRAPANAETLVAVNPTCTHKGCTVAWQADGQKFACPCHNAQFGPDGAVLQGPAASPLSLYEVKVEGDQILVKEA